MYGVSAIETLRTIAADTEAPHATRVSAASALLDRGWGKPLQGVAMMTVAAPKSVREMTDAELMAMIEKKTLGRNVTKPPVAIRLRFLRM